MIHGLKVSEEFYRTQQIKYNRNLTLQIQDVYNLHNRQDGQDLHRLREINQTVLQCLAWNLEMLWKVNKGSLIPSRSKSIRYVHLHQLKICPNVCKINGLHYIAFIFMLVSWKGNYNTAASPKVLSTRSRFFL